MKYCLFLLLALSCINAFPQKHVNRYKHRERQGLWIIYQDSTDTSIDNIGRYRKGVPKGTWKYYDADQHLLKKEKHLFRRIFIIKYYPNGKVYNHGKARIITTDTMIHYYYYGDWYEYDSTGTLAKKQLFRDGSKISEIIYKRKEDGAINDSLVDVLRKMSLSMQLYADSLQLAETAWGRQSAQYKRYVSLSNLNALSVLDDIDRIIERFGYPGKAIAGNENTVIFSIISSAALKYKQKYYDVIIRAADSRELDWADVAYFVDKVKVGIKAPQVYGTQYRIDEKAMKMIYYPIEDKAHLNERRKEKGLPEMELAGIDDNAAY